MFDQKKAIIKINIMLYFATFRIGWWLTLINSNITNPFICELGTPHAYLDIPQDTVWVITQETH